MQTLGEALQLASQAHIGRDWPKAEHLYCQIIAHAEEHPTAYFMLGTLYAQAMVPGRAITFLKRAIELDPKNHSAMHNLASVYRHLENREQAIAWNERSLELDRNALILSNLSGCYINQGCPQKALEYADEALAIQPDFPEAGNHRALALLELGRFEDGWKQYDARIGCVGGQDAHMATVARFTRRPYTVPMWTGGPVKLLAIHGEQGIGDEIMFLTCLKQLRERYEIDDVVVECTPRLVKLMHNSLGLRCYGTHDELVAAERPDAYLPMGSLPRFIWPVIPDAYLKPTTGYATSRQAYRIGLSWFGGHSLTHVQLRNAPIEEWKRLLTLPAQFMSLQYGPRGDEAEVLGIRHDAESIADLDRLAAMIRSCDLVVSVCNTTVHMAGALGVACLALVPSKPAWRYGLTGEKMVWYDSVRMIRQESNEPWSSVIERARQVIVDHGLLSGAQPQAARVAA